MRDFKDQGMEDCITFSAEVIRVIKTMKRVWDTEGGTHTATSGFEGCQAVKSKLRSSESIICIQISGVSFLHMACKPSVVRGCVKPRLPSTKPAQPLHYPAQVTGEKKHSPGSKWICSALGKHRYIARKTTGGTSHCLSAMPNSRPSSGYIYTEIYKCACVCVY